MTSWRGLLVVGIVFGVSVACGDEGEETGSTAVGGSGGAATGGTTNGGTGGTPTGGTAGSAGSAGSLTDAAAGSGGSSAGDAATDAATGGGDGGPEDATPDDSPALDSGYNWPNVLYEGVWFVGWAGGLDHYSWMKFTPSAPGQPNGQWAALDSVCASCTGYFACEGSDGLFSGSTIGTIPKLTLQHPQACIGPTGEEWTIVGFESAPSFPGGALLQLNIQVGDGGGLNLQAFQFPASQCFTSCTNPF